MAVKRSPDGMANRAVRGEAVGMACYATDCAVCTTTCSVGMIGASPFAATLAARVTLLHTWLMVGAVLRLCPTSHG